MQLTVRVLLAYIVTADVQHANVLELVVLVPAVLCGDSPMAMRSSPPRSGCLSPVIENRDAGQPESGSPTMAHGIDN